MYNKKGRSNERPFLLRNWILYKYPNGFLMPIYHRKKTDLKASRMKPYDLKYNQKDKEI